MSLPTCQQRVLDMIENTLQRREPRLSAMFAMFARLNINERIPRIEHLEAPPWWAWHRRGRLRHLGQPALLRAMLLIPLAAMIVVAAMFASMSTSRAYCLPGGGPHGPVVAAGQSHAKACPPIAGLRSYGRP
jgi:hypothetical protein